VCEPHFGKRCRERKLGLADVKHALARPSHIESYEGRDASQGGTNWRVTGPSIDGESIRVGVEAYEVRGAQWALIITLFK